MDLKQLNNVMLLKRFREQLLFGRFEGLNFEPEFLSRGLEKEMNDMIKHCEELK